MMERSLGRCLIWLRNPAHECNMVIKALHERVWFGPDYALLPRGDDGRDFLLQYLRELRVFGPSHMMIPRHLATAERWVP